MGNIFEMRPSILLAIDIPLAICDYLMRVACSEIIGANERVSKNTSNIRSIDNPIFPNGVMNSRSDSVKLAGSTDIVK